MQGAGTMMVGAGSQDMPSFWTLKSPASVLGTREPCPHCRPISPLPKRTAWHVQLDLARQKSMRVGSG